MITALNGTFHGMDDDGTICVMCGGVGYGVVVSDRERSGINARGHNAPLLLFVRTIVKEGGETRLYGFRTADERNLFDKLTTVQGIGPGIALKLLSVHDPAKLRGIILERNADALCLISGVGGKLAGKILSVKL